MDEKEFRQESGQQRLERMAVEDQLHRRQLSSSQNCWERASGGFISGTLLGATMSGLTAIARASQMQIRFPVAAQAVFGASVVGGLSFGMALGTYQAAVCTLRQVRDVDDVNNPMLAGALVGAMSQIPDFVRSKVVTKADALLEEQGMHVIRPQPRFLTSAVGGALVCGMFYMMGDAMRPAPLPKPDGSRQPPQAPRRHPEGEELDTLSSLENPENRDTGEWVFTDPPSGEVLESEDLRWGSK